MKNLTIVENIKICPDLKWQRKCDTLEKDTYRCCPDTCKEKSALTEEQCNELNGGQCIYPNEAQCTGNSDQTSNKYIELSKRCRYYEKNCMKY